MKLIFNSNIQENNISDIKNVAYSNSQKVADSSSTDFFISSDLKKNYILDSTNTFSLDVTTLIPSGQKLAFINIDIVDSDTTINAIRTFNLTLNSVNFGKVSQLTLLNTDTFIPSQILIDGISLTSGLGAVLVIYLGYKIIPTTTTTTTSTTSTTTHTTSSTTTTTT